PSTHTPPTTTSPLSLHDALPICSALPPQRPVGPGHLAVRPAAAGGGGPAALEHGSVVQDHGDHVAARPVLADGGRRQEQRVGRVDRKSTRLNSSHRTISYAVFCL